MHGLIIQKDHRKNPTRCLFVNGIRYSNSAAKFWPALVDEAILFDPATNRIVIHGTSPGKMKRQQLFPEILLKRDLEKLLHQNLEEIMKQTAAELELTGPPSSVTIGLLAENDANILNAELPLDCIDADLLPFFLAWLLHWAAVDEAKWNNEFLEGSFKAEDKCNKQVYDWSFILRNRYLAEDLYERTCTLFL